MDALAQEARAEKFRALNLECNLMIFHRVECACSDYFARSGLILIPSIIQTAEEKMIDPLELFADYAREFHSQHEDDGVIFP